MLTDERIAELVADYHNDDKHGALVRLIRKIEAEVWDKACERCAEGCEGHPAPSARVCRDL